MAIQQRGASAWATTASGTSVAPSVPTVANGDFMVLGVFSSDVNNHAWSTPSGWTLAQTINDFILNAGGGNCALYYRLASSEPGSYTVTYGGTSSLAAQILTYKSTTGGTLSYDTSSKADNTASTTDQSATITLAQANEMVVFFGSFNGSEISITPGLAGDNSTRLGAAPSCFSCDSVYTTSGSIASPPSTTGSPSNANTAFLIAIKEAAVVIPYPFGTLARQKKKPRRRMGRRHALDLMGWTASRSSVVVPAMPWTAKPRKKIKKKPRKRPLKDGMGWLPQVQAGPAPQFAFGVDKVRRWPERFVAVNLRRGPKRISRTASWIPPPPPAAPSFPFRQVVRRRTTRSLGGRPLAVVNLLRGPKRVNPRDRISWIPFSSSVNFPGPHLTQRRKPRRRPWRKPKVPRRLPSFRDPSWFPPPPVIPPNVYITPEGYGYLGCGLVVNAFGCNKIVLPTSVAGNNQIGSYDAAGTAIQAAKVQRQHQKAYGQAGAVFAEQKVVHVVRGATYTLLEFLAFAGVPPAGADTVTVDLLRQGVSVLTAPIVLTSSVKAYTGKSATFQAITPAAGDIYEVKVTPSGTSAQRVGARLTLREDPQ